MLFGFFLIAASYWTNNILQNLRNKIYTYLDFLKLLQTSESISTILATYQACKNQLFQIVSLHNEIALFEFHGTKYPWSMMLTGKGGWGKVRSGRTKCNPKSFTKGGIKRTCAGSARLLKWQTCHAALQLSNFLSDKLPSQPPLSIKFPLLNKLSTFVKDMY